MNKRIVTAAITGSIHTPTMSPYLPITPEQIADEAVRAYEAGATVAHIHVRDPKTGEGSADLDLFREVATNVKSRCNIILCLTTGGTLGDPIEKRARIVPTLKPELASLNFGSLNFGIFHIPERLKIKEFKFPWETEYMRMTEDFVLRHTFKDLKVLGQIFTEEKTKPEIEIYDIGMINNVAYMIEKGYFIRPVYLQFVMGVLGGIPVSTNNLLFMYNTAKEIIGDFVWSVPDDIENAGCTDPNDDDSDDDGIKDGIEDANHNGIFDSGETNPCDTDTDNDGLDDGVEDANQNGIIDSGETNPRNGDTDGDGMPDGWEIQEGLNPLMNDASEDADGDGFSNLIEYRRGTDPNDSEDYPSVAMPWVPLLLLDD